MHPALSYGRGYQWSVLGGLHLPEPPVASCKQQVNLWTSCLAEFHIFMSGVHSWQILTPVVLLV
jgi:hypothetical protein